MTDRAPAARRLLALAVALTALLASLSLTAGDASAAKHPRAKRAMPTTKQITGRKVARAGKPIRLGGHERFNTGSRPATMSQFLSDTTNIVRGFWRQVGVGTEVSFYWGEGVGTNACGGRVFAGNPQYCGADNTIYIAESYARDLWNGVASSPGDGRAYGDFAVAYLVAHECAHNVQFALRGTLKLNGRAKPVELEADCLAGVWANNAYWTGRLEAGDIEEASATTLALGDRYFDNPDHHGTPQERQAAFMQGYNTGNGRGCTRTYLGF